MTPEQLTELYLLYKPDVVKLDCEGCEAQLLGLSDDIFGIPKYYVMETHTEEHTNVIRWGNHNIRHLHMKIHKRLVLAGYTMDHSSLATIMIKDPNNPHEYIVATYPSTGMIKAHRP